MERQYIVLDTGYIQYEENGYTYTIPTDPVNSDYQAYLTQLAQGGNN